MKLLIIEDNEPQRRLLAKIVQKISGIEPILVPDALEGYVALKAISGIEMVILDHNLPYINGVNFLKKLRNEPRFTDLPVVVSSADDMVQQFKEAGANECLIKPYDVERLLEYIRLFKNVNKDFA